MDPLIRLEEKVIVFNNGQDSALRKRNSERSEEPKNIHDCSWSYKTLLQEIRKSKYPP